MVGLKFESSTLSPHDKQVQMQTVKFSSRLLPAAQLSSAERSSPVLPAYSTQLHSRLTIRPTYQTKHETHISKHQVLPML